jgi:hypothetical protein
MLILFVSGQISVQPVEPGSSGRSGDQVSSRSGHVSVFAQTILLLCHLNSCLILRHLNTGLILRHLNTGLILRHLNTGLILHH